MCLFKIYLLILNFIFIIVPPFVYEYLYQAMLEGRLPSQVLPGDELWTFFMLLFCKCFIIYLVY